MIESLFQNRWLLIATSAIFGGIVALLLYFIKNKTSILRYSIRIERIATQIEQQAWGNVKILWNDKVVPNLFMATIEVENRSTCDHENILFSVSSHPDTKLLSDQAIFVDHTQIIRKSEDYHRLLYVEEGEKPSSQQFDIYYHRREYIVQIFNRGERIRFNFLSMTNEASVSPGIFIDCLHRGVKLKKMADHPAVFNVPVKSASLGGLISTLFVVIISGLYIDNIWIALALCTLMALGAQLVGVIEFKALRWLKSKISG